MEEASQELQGQSWWGLAETNPFSCPSNADSPPWQPQEEKELAVYSDPRLRPPDEPLFLLLEPFPSPTTVTPRKTHPPTIPKPAWSLSSKPRITLVYPP